MTIDEGIDLVDTILRLRREVAGLARSVDATGASFVAEWRAVLEELQARLASLAHLESQLEPVLTPSGVDPFTLLELRHWLQQAASRDEDARPLPPTRSFRTLQPSVH